MLPVLKLQYSGYRKSRIEEYKPFQNPLRSSITPDLLAEVQLNPAYNTVSRENELSTSGVQGFEGQPEVHLTPVFFFLFLKKLFLDNFRNSFQSIQSSNCSQKELNQICFFQFSYFSLIFALILSYLHPTLNNPVHHTIYQFYCQIFNSLGQRKMPCFERT